MTTIGAVARRWIRRLPAALLGLDIPGEQSRGRAVIATYTESRTPFSLCPYSDAEYQILLHELHYRSLGSHFAESACLQSDSGLDHPQSHHDRLPLKSAAELAGRLLLPAVLHELCAHIRGCRFAVSPSHKETSHALHP